MERNPCQVLDLRFERLEKVRAVLFQESNRNAVAIKHAVAGERRELRSGARMPARFSGVAPETEARLSSGARRLIER